MNYIKIWINNSLFQYLLCLLLLHICACYRITMLPSLSSTLMIALSYLCLLLTHPAVARDLRQWIPLISNLSSKILFALLFDEYVLGSIFLCVLSLLILIRPFLQMRRIRPSKIIILRLLLFLIRGAVQGRMLSKCLYHRSF